jgi:hypothetical protein
MQLPYLPRGVASACERIEARAWTDAVLALSEREGNLLRATVQEVDTVNLTSVAAFDFGPFNRGIGLGIEKPAAERTVAEIVDFYGRAGVLHFSISVSPLAEPPQLGGWLAARGLSRGVSSAKLWRSVGTYDAGEPTFRIEQIGSSEASAWAGVQRAAWGMPKGMTPWFTSTVGRPGWSHFLGFDADLPVTAGALFAWGRTCWLGFGATIPTHRGRGGQTGTLARRIQAAHELGCDLAVTETDDPSDTPNPSYANLVRAGFGLAYLRSEYGP